MNQKDSQTAVAEKQKSLTRFLDDDDYVLVHLDPRNKDLFVPEHLTRDSSVTLKLSRYFRGKLEINEDVICAELLFGGEYFNCVIPFSAVWGCTSETGENIIWPESTPEEVLKNLLETAEAKAKERPAEAETTEESTPDDLPRKGHLRRVK